MEKVKKKIEVNKKVMNYKMMSLSPKMHPGNIFSPERVRLDKLAMKNRELLKYIVYTRGKPRLDWSNREAVICFNKVCFKRFLGVVWDFGAGDDFLLPSLGSRMNYLLEVKDFFESSFRKFDENTKVFEIGVGGNCVHLLLGVFHFKVKFEGSEVNKRSIKKAKEILQANGLSRDLIRETTHDNILKNVIKPEEEFDIVVCNPPFFDSMEAKNTRSKPDFKGQMSELVTPGGETRFISRMIQESISYKDRIKIFSSFIGKKSSISVYHKLLTSTKLKNPALDWTVRDLNQGRTKRWAIIWSFNSSKGHKN